MFCIYYIFLLSGGLMSLLLVSLTSSLYKHWELDKEMGLQFEYIGIP